MLRCAIPIRATLPAGEGVRLLTSAATLPLWIAFTGREPDDFEDMVFRVSEVKRLDACRAFVPRRQRLRSSRNMLHLVQAQLLVSFVHVVDDDCDMLKPMVVTL